MTHRCPGPRCETDIPSALAFCRRHWFQLSTHRRAEIWDSWRNLCCLREDGPLEEQWERLKAHQELIQATAATLPLEGGTPS